jgi:hypothetical protein
VANLDINRILVIGPNKGLRSSKLCSLNVNLYELSTIIWYPSTLYNELLERGNTYGAVELSRNKIGELVEWVRRGHCLCIIGALPYHELEHSKQSIHSKYRPISEEPFAGIAFEPKTGHLIEFCGLPSVGIELTDLIQHMSYKGLLKGSQLAPLLRVSRGRQGQDQVVGGFKHLGAGLVIFVPDLQAPEYFLDIYHHRLAALPQYLLESASEALPTWAAFFLISKERTALQEIEKLDAAIARLEKEVSDQRSIISTSNTLKHLFTASGETFVRAVSNVLQELGLRVIEGPKGRADLIATDGKRIAAIEVKGLDGPARESNLRQTERWVSDTRSALTSDDGEILDDPDLKAYAGTLAQLGIGNDSGISTTNVKGVMVIGTYRKLPPDQRTEPSFPDPLERVLNRSDVCALSGMQLLGLLIQAQTDPQQKAAIVDMLFSTQGVIAGSTDWTGFLHRAPERP